MPELTPPIALEWMPSPDVEVTVTASVSKLCPVKDEVDLGQVAIPGAFPAYCTIRTEERHNIVLLPASALFPPTPDDDWDVHVLRALLAVTPSDTSERITR